MENHGLPIIDAGGEPRVLANLAAPIRYGWTLYGDVPNAPIVPRGEWAELIGRFPAGPEHPDLPYIHDQDGVGQCNADATAAVVEFVRAQAGLPFVKLSAPDLYDRINGGSDRGSLLEDGIREAMERGIGTAATCGTLWRRGMPLASASERAKYRALECYLCPTFDHVMSAVLMGFAVVSGIMWFNNYKPDADGWLPARGSGQGGGHAVMGYKPAHRNGQFGVWHQNSWTAQWGVAGRCVFPESAYAGPVGGWWAIRSAVSEPGNFPAPK